MKRLQWIWCWACYKLYLALPPTRTHKSLSGRFQLWLLGYGGAYGYSEDFKWFCENAQFGRRS